MHNFLNLLISWVLVTVIVVGLITLRCVRPKMKLPPYERMLTLGVLLLVIHAAHVLCCISFFPDRRELDWAAPYGLLYPALLYFTVQAAASRQPIPKLTIFLHCLPFIVALGMYGYLIAAGINKDTPLFVSYREGMYDFMICSFLAYGFWVWFFPREIHSLSLQKLLNAAVMMLVLLGILYVATSLTVASQSSLDRYLPRLMIYLIMLILTVLLFRHKLVIVKYIEPYIGRDAEVIKATLQEENKTQLIYGKSAISNEKLVMYEEKIKAIMLEEQLFLDPLFSLDRLAEHLHISKHHLSQVFSLRFGKGFASFLGELRINYALALLQKTEEKINIENLAYECGFNSKVSFNRHFKQLVGVSPSAYRKRLLGDR